VSRRCREQEFNYAAVLGLGAAVDYALGIGLEKIAARVRREFLLDLVLR
jgi:selenocysteine lyase/cysteine desulfurase